MGQANHMILIYTNQHVLMLINIAKYGIQHT